MPWAADRPYNDLPPVPVEELETKPILRACIGARAALAELKQAAELLPNPTVLVNTIPKLEAQASSEIEQVVTTADALFRYADAEHAADPATKEALRYQSALLEGYRTLESRPLGTGTAELVCSRIRGQEVHVRRVPGTALRNATTNEIIYTPPEGADRIRSLLAGWERLLHDATELDPLIRLAAGHYQFEAIHPFTDGNGRTGRILNGLFLVEVGLLPLPILYLSRYLIQRRSEYYRLLLEVTESSAWEPWILFMVEGVQDTASWTTAKIAAIRTLGDETARVVRRELPKIYSRELIDVLFSQPYVRIRNLVEADIVERQAASRYLKELVAVGVLQEEAVGREKLFRHPRLMNLLIGDSNEFDPF